MKSKNWEKKLKRNDLKYETNKKLFDFTSNITINEAERDQNNLLENMAEFNDRSRPRS